MIEVRNLHKQLGAQHVLRGIDLEVRKGETCAVIGRSGGGKSVLLKHFIGLFKPTSGEVIVEGENIATLPERKLGALRKKIGILFQSAALFDSMNVEENIAFPLREAGIRDRTVLRDRVVEGREERVRMTAVLRGPRHPDRVVRRSPVVTPSERGRAGRGSKVWTS